MDLPPDITNAPPTWVVYHGGCDDGFGAALAMQTAQGLPKLHFIGGVYAIPMDPAEFAGLDVVFVDFSYKRNVMKAIADRAKSLLVIDHHLSARDDLRGLEAECPNVRLEFDLSQSGAMLTWKHYHKGEPIPLFYRYLQARDLWKMDSMPNVAAFSHGLRSYPQNFTQWRMFLEDAAVPKLISDGMHVLQYIRQKLTQTYANRFEAVVAGHRTLLCNMPYFLASDMADYMLEMDPALEFACTFFYVDGGKVQFSLRSRSEFDVQRIAKRFGGGGHAQAAGFTIPAPADFTAIEPPTATTS